MSVRKMKDSGIESIGEIPEEWKVCRLKNVINFNPRYAEDLPEGTEVSFVPMEYLGNGKLEFQAKPIEVVVKGYNYFANGDIVMAKVTPCFENGNIAIANNLLSGVGFGSSEIYTLRCFGCNTKFIFYFLQNRTFKNRCVSSMYGVAGLKRIPIEFLQDYKLFMPPFSEQKAIAGYLDEKCAAIDQIVASKQKQNEQLAEYRQSLITEAVTKGLNPSVPMKDSGIEWIGETPKEWQVSTLKYNVNLVAEKSGEVDSNCIYIGLENVVPYVGKIAVGNERETIGDTLSFCKGDVLFGKLRPYLAKCFLAEFDGVCSGEFFVIRENGRMIGNYTKYLMLSEPFLNLVIGSTYGVKMPRASWEFVGNVKLPLPPLAEQKEIAAYLDKKCGDIDALREHNKNIIESLQEYKQSLIYEAVTGKIEL